MKLGITTFVCGLAMILASIAPAQVPGSIINQGRLTDSNGAPLENDPSSANDGQIDLVFRIYDALTGGSEVWNLTTNNVPVFNGLFSVLLTNLNTTVFPAGSQANRWLEVEVRTNGVSSILSPRKELVSVPYAMRAGDAATLGGNQASEFLLLSGGSLVGDLTLSGGARIQGTAIIDSQAITDGTIANADIADSAVTGAKIADNAVTSAKIADNTIIDADISPTANIAGTKIAAASTNGPGVVELAADGESAAGLAVQANDSRLRPPSGVAGGHLSVANLTVSNDAAIMGNLYFSSTVSGTNEGGTATGGTIITNGNYRIHTFTNVGTANFIVSGGPLVCDVMVVAGGGGGGTQHGGGGGAGGLIYDASYPVTGGTYTVIVGAGGAGAPAGPNGTRPPGTPGGISVFGSLTAIGGGGGGSYNPNYKNPGARPTTGGSGGGAASANYPGEVGAPGTPGQGNAGGDGTAVNYCGGGGGGAGAVGATSTGAGAAGGDGLAYDISGSMVYYAGGGGGGANLYANPGGGPGGLGGGGAGKGVTYDTGDGGPGVPNTGGGGGTGGSYTNKGGNGGSGIVIVRYPITAFVSALTISSNGISQVSTSGVNSFMGKVGIGIDNPAEKLHVAGNLRLDGAMTLGDEPRSNWPTMAVGALIASNNLSDLTDQAAARANLGLGSAATNEANVFLSPTSDGSQLINITAEQVGAVSTNAGALLAANNLLELSASAATARSNLGLGSAATNEVSAFLSTGGGNVNGNVSVSGSVSVDAPSGDIPMGVYTNQ